MLIGAETRICTLQAIGKDYTIFNLYKFEFVCSFAENKVTMFDFLKAGEHKSEEGFISKAQYLKDNWSWLKYSYAISIRIRRRMGELGITQKELAAQLGCTQQHVSVLLGGKANMTLETIAKLEKALSFGLIADSFKEFNCSITENQSDSFLNYSALNELVAEGGKVDLYKTRKKKGPQK